MRRLIWGFAGCTYHIVGNLKHWPQLLFLLVCLHVLPNYFPPSVLAKNTQFFRKWYYVGLFYKISWGLIGLSFKPNIYVPWSTSELRVRLAQWNRFKPSSKIFYWPFQGGTSYEDYLCFFVSCVSHAFTFVHCCLVVTFWLLLVMFIVFLLRSHVVSWVRCGTCIVSWFLPSFCEKMADAHIKQYIQKWLCPISKFWSNLIIYLKCLIVMSHWARL